MDLKAFDAADNAVKKLAKDYQPVTALTAALDEIRSNLVAVGDLQGALTKLKAETAVVKADKAKADSELVGVKKLVAQEQAILDRVRQAVSVIKQNLSQG